ncbi:MAG: Minf_1886 family protein [Candidatus Omnitrophota bacterium]
METDFNNIIEQICECDSRYKIDAYEFVMEALTYTQKRFKCAKHVSGEDMLKGMKDLLMEKYGPMTLTVLKHWGIQSTEDFGHVVFNLVEKKVLSKTEDDRIEHFRDAYDFQEVFDRGYRKILAKKISRMRSI